MVPKKSFFSRLFKKKFSSRLIDEKFRIEEAFTYNGIKYFHFPDQFQVPTGRQMMALAYYEELTMKCDKEYLELHTKAMDKILSNPKSVSLQTILQLNINLKERLELIPLPDYIFRMASVIFFDESESIYTYDFAYNRKKLRSGNNQRMFCLFLKTPLNELIPSLEFVAGSSPAFFQVAELIDQTHHTHLTEVLSQKV